MFDNFIGYNKEKHLMDFIINSFKDEEIYKKKGNERISSVLISGDLGIGKSTFVKDIIKEMNVKTFIFKQVQDKYESIINLSNMFEEASKEKCALIVVEDIDSFKDTNKELFYTLLGNIRQYKNRTILVIATFNHNFQFMYMYDFTHIFNERIHLFEPSKEDSRNIIEHLLKNQSISPNFNYDDLNEAYLYLNSNCFNKLINESIMSKKERKEYLVVDDVIKTILKPQHIDELNDNQIKGNALKKAGCLAISEILNKDSARFVSVSNYSEDFYQNCCKDDNQKALVMSGAKAALDLFGDDDYEADCESELKSVKYSIESIINNDRLKIFFKDFVRVKDYEDEAKRFYDREVKECVKEAKVMLYQNRKFVLKLYEELYKKHYLLWSDIKRIRDEYMIEKNKD